MNERTNEGKKQRRDGCLHRQGELSRRSAFRGSGFQKCGVRAGVSGGAAPVRWAGRQAGRRSLGRLGTWASNLQPGT